MALNPIEERFWELADKSGKCWVWTGRLDKDGYGRFPAGSKAFGTDRAPRIAYILSHNGILPDFVPDHTCFNRACIRPKHLKLQTRSANAARTSRTLKTVCKRGHPRTPENRRPDSGNGHKCRLCHEITHRERRTA